jgi:hypothetical protein
MLLLGTRQQPARLRLTALKETRERSCGALAPNRERLSHPGETPTRTESRLTSSITPRRPA